jgi:hypothetical protein
MDEPGKFLGGCSESEFQQRRMNLSDKKFPKELWVPGFFHSLGSVLVQSLSDSVENNSDTDFSSIIISRHRFKTRIDHESHVVSKELDTEIETRDKASKSSLTDEVVEVYISPDCLAGLLPEALLDAFKFWRISENRICGYPRPASEVATFKEDYKEKEDKKKEQRKNQFWGGSMIRVDLVQSKNGLGAVIYRLPQPASIDDSLGPQDTSERDRLEMRSKAVTPQVLLDACHAAEDSSLGVLAKIFMRLDSLSHILFWSSSGSSCHDMIHVQELDLCEISKIELTRLQISFHLRVDFMNQTRVFSDNEAGLFVSEKFWRAANFIQGIRNSLLLENDFGDCFILLPNYPLKRLVIDKFIASEYRQDSDTMRKWASTFEKRYFVYPIHPCRTFLSMPSFSGALYLAYVYIIVRRYVDASKILASSFSNTEFSAEERFSIDCIGNLISGRHSSSVLHPDECACLIRIACICIHCKEKIPFDLSQIFQEYVRNSEIISAGCRLSQDDMLPIYQSMGLTVENSRHVFDKRTNVIKGSLLWSNMFSEISEYLKVQISAVEADPPIQRPKALKFTYLGGNTCKLKWDFTTDDSGDGSQRPNQLKPSEGVKGAALNKMRVCSSMKSSPINLGFHIEYNEKPIKEGADWILLPLVDPTEETMHGKPVLVEVLDNSATIQLNRESSFRFRVRAVNRIGPGYPSDECEVQLSTLQQGEAENSVTKQGNRENQKKDRGDVYLFGQHPLSRLWYTRPSNDGKVSGAAVIRLLGQLMQNVERGERQDMSGFMLLYEMLLGCVSFRILEKSSGEMGTNQISMEDLNTKEGNTCNVCPMCSSKNDRRSPTCWQPRCSHFFLHCNREAETGLSQEDANISLIHPCPDKTTLSYLIIILKALILGCTKIGAIPFCMVPSAFEIAAISSFVFSYPIDGDSTPYSQLSIPESPCARDCAMKKELSGLSGLSLEYGDGLKFLKTMINACKHVNFDWIIIDPKQKTSDHMSTEMQCEKPSKANSSGEIGIYVLEQFESTKESLGLSRGEANAFRSKPLDFFDKYTSAHEHQEFAFSLVSRYTSNCRADSKSTKLPCVDVLEDQLKSSYENCYEREYLQRLLDDFEKLKSKQQQNIVQLQCFDTKHFEMLHAVSNDLDRAESQLDSEANETNIRERNITYIPVVCSICKIQQIMHNLSTELSCLIVMEDNRVSETVEHINRILGHSREKSPECVKFNMQLLSGSRMCLDFNFFLRELLSSGLKNFNIQDEASISRSVLCVLFRVVRMNQMKSCLGLCWDLHKSAMNVLNVLVLHPRMGIINSSQAHLKDIVQRCFILFECVPMPQQALTPNLDQQKIPSEEDLQGKVSAALELVGHLHEQQRSVDLGIADEREQLVCIAQTVILGQGAVLLRDPLITTDTEFTQHVLRSVVRLLTDERETIDSLHQKAAKGFCYQRINMERLSLKIEVQIDPNLRVQPSKENAVAASQILQMQANSLASLLSSERVYIRNSSTPYTYDPRLLAFEFMTGFMLRGSQFDILKVFLNASKEITDSSKEIRDVPEVQGLVHQMIMGSGKSTVVGPLLSWLVSNPKNLVLQVVPDPLLRQTRSIMQSLFGYIVPKRVQIFNFDRSSTDADEIQILFSGLEEARRLQSVVCTTPSSLKCLLLKYVEALEEVNSYSKKLCHPRKEWVKTYGTAWGEEEKKLNGLIKHIKKKEAFVDILAQIIRMFKASTAVVDEVDWVSLYH